MVLPNIIGVNLDVFELREVCAENAADCSTTNNAHRDTHVSSDEN
jgi:hypothetical protein